MHVSSETSAQALPLQCVQLETNIEYAHGSSYPAFDRSIDVQVSRIRNKLERDPKTPSLIRTVRNAGYIFSSDVTRG